MVIGKRAQFFLLAAVIISVVVLSLGVTVNRAVVSDEPDNLFDFSYEVNREIGAVMDYEVYTGIEGGGLDEFVDLLADDIKESNPDSDFFFVYWDEDNATLRNYGVEDASAEGEDIPDVDEEVKSTICIRNFCKDVASDVEDFDGDFSYYTLKRKDIEGDEVTVNVGENEFIFPLSDYKQVIFVIQKDVGDETFVAIR